VAGSVQGTTAVDRRGRGGGVAEIQRARMIAAMVEVARERGAGHATVAHVVARSGVSRRTFYELFADREACFIAAFDQAVQRAAQRVVPAFEGGASWCTRIRAGLGALLEFLDDEPGLAMLCVVDALGGGPRVLERRARVVTALVDAVDAGGARTGGGFRPTRLTAEGVVGAVLGVLHTRLAVNGEGPRSAGRVNAGRVNGRHARMVARMVDLTGPLMAMIVLPYLGRAAAARELARPAPPPRRAASPQRDPLRDLHMRLTYRTVQVLAAIAANPGASNRQIADAAGVHDQGQISKLLARLGHLGLIRNGCDALARGEPNAWQLTSRGEEIERTLRQATPQSKPHPRRKPRS
jgi:AcrR family transcriptional regulator/DNA-binding MarR family transcriptional regulator